MKKGIIGVIAVLLCFHLYAAKSESITVNLSKLKKSYSVKNEKKSLSLGGYGSFVEFEIEISKDGEYAIVLEVENSNSLDARTVMKLEKDKNYFNSQLIMPTEKKEIYVNRICLMEKGNHSFKLSAPFSGFTVNKIVIMPADDNIKSKISPAGLVNKNATEKTKKLYDYLCNMQGKAILSGQQINESNVELNVINETIGKYPAIMGIDLMNYSPAFVERGARGNIIRRAKAWAKQGGLISCSWHWCAPKDLIDEDKPEMRWYDGFRAKATNFDFSKAISNHNSEEYKLIIRDIDAIAVQLKSLQEADIPVLWRPIHEASGGWFWWGARGSKNYIELYKILYDRLVNYHKLNNLIWVWNAQDAKWYPGDEYVDVLSFDTYPGKRIYKTFDNELAELQSATSVPKLYALSENGPLPDITKLAQQNGIWSWFCTWNSEFVIDSNDSFSEEYTDLNHFKTFYDNPFVITNDELPQF